MNEILKPGKYYLGDPSFVLPDKIYHGIWGNLYNYENGNHNINGSNLVVHNIHGKDGIHRDTKNRLYIIYSGMIGLTSAELIEDINLCNGKGYLFDFKQKINFIYDAGIFYIKSGKKYIKIDTRNLDDYDSEYEEHCKNDDGENILTTICGDSDNDSLQEENKGSSDNEEEEKEVCTQNEENTKFNFFKKT
jgi:hypothetical protein